LVLGKRQAHESPRELLRRASALQGICRALLSHLQVSVQPYGQCPERGLLVSNHVSFLDILVLGALHPLVFVSKAEVERWPLVGFIASATGTLFIQRQKRSDVFRVNEQIQQSFDAGLLVCIFPEGTSSDGSQVLPFQPSLLQPALSAKLPIYPAHIRYCTPNGDRIDEVAYFGDRSLSDCLTALVRRRHTIAEIRFGAALDPEESRKVMAARLHTAVSALAPAPTRVEPACLDALTPSI
jgi:1-acyl-sn-glycerol-3-phosphate acyltransferase